MVFSINAVESGQNNFANFQALANRTTTSAGGANGSPSGSPNGGSGSESPGGKDNGNNNNAAVSSLSFGSASLAVIVAVFAVLV